MKQNNLPIGNTPLIKIDLGISNINVWAKLESYNLSGSIKDRMVLYMLLKAKQRGLLKKDITVIEATTGNTGIALAAMSKYFGYKLIVTMPKDASIERIKLTKIYGAQVILTPKKEGPAGAIKARKQVAQKISNVWSPDQFNNHNNTNSHIFGLAKETASQLNQKIDYIIHGIGTGGTLMGLAYYFKKINPNIKIVAVEPEESAVLSGGKPRFHGIQGIGEGFIPSLVNKKMVDETIKVNTKEAIFEVRALAKKSGLFVGFSSGANISAIKKLASKIKRKVNILTIFADRGDRYLSLL